MARGGATRTPFWSILHLMHDLSRRLRLFIDTCFDARESEDLIEVKARSPVEIADSELAAHAAMIDSSRAWPVNGAVELSG